MKINLFFLFIYFLCLNISAQEKAVTPEEIVLTLDAENKKITFPVQFISNEQMLEVFACTEQGPIHETVLLIQPLGVKLHEAIKKIGLTEAIHWQYPLEEGFQLTMGDKVVMKIFFEGKKESDSVYVEDLLVYSHTETPCFLRGWSFKGDQVTVEGKVSPTPEVEFSLINKGRQKSPTTMLLNPSNFFQIDEPEYKVAAKYKPLMKKMNDPNKTKGTLVLVPATEEFIATENAKRYENKTGLLTKNIEIAKKVDALKKKFITETRQALMSIIEKGSVEGISEADKNKLIQKHQSLALSASSSLLEINFLYHQMAKNEYEFLLSVMPANTEETKAFKVFACELIGFLTKENGYKFQAKAEESLAFEANQEALALGAKQVEKIKESKAHDTQKTINLLYADVQPLLFRQLAIADQVETETNKLKEPEVVASKILKETFEKSIRKAKLESAFFKGMENYFLKKIQYLQDTIKDGADVNKSDLAARLSLLEAVNFKFAILESAHKDRLKLLNDYMLEDKKETDYYKKKIEETEGQIKNVLKAMADIKIIIDDKAPGYTLEALAQKYQEHLIIQ
jgi:hypothetical protein